jgi:hypothetical protein
VAQPDITVAKVLHYLTDADAHVDSHNKAKQDMAFQKAVVYALLLIAEELDQLGDCLAVLAKLKEPGEAQLT